MSNWNQQLAAASNARSPHGDVVITLDNELAEERQLLTMALIAAAAMPPDARLGLEDPTQKLRDDIAAVEAKMVDTLVTLRFYRIPGDAWSHLTAIHPARHDAPSDRRYGYNLDAVVRAAAGYSDPTTDRKYVFRIEAGEEVPLIIEKATLDNPHPTNELDTLFRVLSGAEVQRIRDVVWELNDYGPQLRIAELVKISGAATRSEQN